MTTSHISNDNNVKCCENAKADQINWDGIRNLKDLLDIIIICIIIIKKGWQCKAERECISVRRSQPHNTNQYTDREREKE